MDHEDTKPASEAENDVYTQLDAEKGEIRLCTIKPGAWDDEVHCEMEVSSPCAETRYVCLSYVSIESQDMKEIYLDGSEYLVVPTLHTALKALRAEGVVDGTWIDAFCINQEDHSGKENRVVCNIFEDAAQVFVWLGDPGRDLVHCLDRKDMVRVPEQDTDLDDGIEFLQHFADNKHFHEMPCFEKCGSSSCPSTLSAPEKSFARALEALGLIMDADWFEEIWKVQEIVLARSATVLIGRRSFSWTLIEEAWSNWAYHLKICCGECMFSHRKPVFKKFHRFAGRVIDLINARTFLKDGEPILESLMSFKCKRAADPRDKIYGLLDLQSSPNIIELQPDYAATVQQVYTDFASELIRSQGWVVPLHLDLNQVTEGLPSWVPDWEYTTKDPSSYSVSRFVETTSYHASDGLEGNVDVLNGTTLKVTGIEVDSIAELSSAYVIKRRPTEQIDLEGEWYEFLDLKTRGDEPYISSGTLEEAFFSTMFANRYYEDHTCRPIQSDDVEGWQEHIREVTRRLREHGPNAVLTLPRAMTSHVTAVLGRKLFVSTKGYVGVCPDTAKPGDKFFVLCDCPSIIFLRPVKTADSDCREEYRALGHGYVHGLMDGEVLEMDILVKDVLIV